MIIVEASQSEQTKLQYTLSDAVYHILSNHKTNALFIHACITGGGWLAWNSSTGMGN